MNLCSFSLVKFTFFSHSLPYEEQRHLQGSFKSRSALICKIQETSVFYFKYPEGTQCKFHFISAMLLCVLLSWWWAARGMWCYLRVIHLKYEL